MTTDRCSLIGDVGATNARFALADGRGFGAARILRCADHATFEEAVEVYLAGTDRPRPRRAAVALAGPVSGGVLRMTNHPWCIEPEQARRRLRLAELTAVNDFVAAALSVPALGPGDRVQIGAGQPAPGEAVGVIGPGSGLGMATLTCTAAGWRALPGEGGHASATAQDDREAAVLAAMRRRFGHVSAERVASGSGLVWLHDALLEVDGGRPATVTPAEVTTAARDGTCPVCVETVALFLAFLGSAAGNLALTVGARGGVYVAGGVVPRVLDLVEGSRFRERFEGKGRMASFLEPIPTYVVTHELPAFLGLSAMLREREPA